MFVFIQQLELLSTYVMFDVVRTGLRFCRDVCLLIQINVKYYEQRVIMLNEVLFVY